MDARLARFNMVEQQIRPWGVLDSAVLDVLHSVDRQNFVPSNYRELAFADTRIPIGHGQYMMEPRLEGRLLQALAPRRGESILEIGTGSGFMTALLAATGAEVTSVEMFSDLSERAVNNLREIGLGRVRTIVGDGARGWPEGGPWDGILLTASAPEIPHAIVNALSNCGRLVAVIGEDPTMQAMIVKRGPDGSAQHHSLFETWVAPMIGALQKPVFLF
jgi:protein-L-isoaspartate(D-aspartate) O-methyltransferase